MDVKKSVLFETTRIGSMELANRFVRSASHRGMCDEGGLPTPDLLRVIRELAAGQVGFIISGFAYVTKGGQVVPAMIGCHSDEVVPGLRKMSDETHRAGGKIALQIVHGGVFSSIGNPELTGQPALGPSPFPTEQGNLGREATKVEIGVIVEAFAAAARRAREAGFDAVQIHAAHGFVLSQFLSPFFNKRIDEYGGTLENRSRMLLETVAAVKGAVGDGFPVLVKINSEDLLDGGFTTGDMLGVCAMLEDAGVDAIELTGGTALGVIIGNYEITYSKTQSNDIYWLTAAKELRKRVKTPLMLVGGIRTFEDSLDLVESNTVDYVSFSRPLLREPGLIARWKRGDLRPALCISDNLCFEPKPGLPYQCVHAA